MGLEDGANHVRVEGRKHLLEPRDVLVLDLRSLRRLLHPWITDHRGGGRERKREGEGERGRGREGGEREKGRETERERIIR